MASWQRNDDRGQRRLDATGSTQEVNAGAAVEAGAATAAGAAGAAAEEIEQSAAPARPSLPGKPAARPGKGARASGGKS